MTYDEADEPYKPMWFDRTNGWDGQTYQEALGFCGAMSSYTLCSYEVICPMGEESPNPLGGFRDEQNGSWVPVVNSENAWTKVSSDAGCLLDIPPEWELSEETTRHVVCCLTDPLTATTSSKTPSAAITTNTATSSGPDDEIISMTFETIGKLYEPLSYDRSKRWDGQTYIQAMSFCSSVRESYTICPYEAICPFGRGECIVLLVS